MRTIDLAGVPRWVRESFERYADEFAERGILADGRLAFADAVWAAAGALPEYPSADRDEEWALLQQAFAAALGVERQRWTITSEGHFGSPEACLRLAVDDAQSVRGAVLPAHALPVTVWIAARIEAERDATMAGQLAAWGRLRTDLDRIRALLPNTIEVALEPYLASVEVQQPASFGLRWNEARLGAFRGLVSLEVTVRGADGSECVVPLDAVDSATGIVTTASHQHVLLPPAVNAVVKVARTKQRQIARKVAAEIADPTRLIPEGIDVDSYFDLSQYSERVTGFEPARAAAKDIKPSGVDWFRETDIAEATPLVPADGDAGRAGAGDEIEKPTRYVAVIEALDASMEGVPAAVEIERHTVPWRVTESQLRAGFALKPYQRAGVAWLWSHAEDGRAGVLLADDMGLGKTFQVLVFIALRIATGRSARKPTLVVAPTILLENWKAEIERFFTPKVFELITILHGNGLRQFRAGPTGLDVDKLAHYDVVITNYETLASYQPSLLKVDFDTVVLDEAQAVKNELTMRSRAAQGLKRTFTVAMTGTPVENKLSDLWAIYDALEHRPERRTFGRRSSFEQTYESQGPAGIAAVRKTIGYPGPRSSLLRREKSDALRDLPPKSYHSHAVPMTVEQHGHERTIARLAVSGKHLQALQRLQQLYQHPSLYTHREPASVSDAIATSPKLEALLSVLETIADAGEKALVFTPWVRMQDMLATVLRDRFRLKRVRIINGDPENRARALEAIAEFSKGLGFDVLVLSPLAAGTGLTITAANHVVHYGRWWNPAKEDQATDRAYRIGQTRPVHVHHLILHHPDSPEEGFDVKLHHLVERKRCIARDFLTADPSADIDARELADLAGSIPNERSEAP